MSTVAAILGQSPIDRYLRQCQVRNTMERSEMDTSVPPQPEEVKQLLAYLKQQGVDAAVVGSVGVLHYVKDASKFRPTVDLDLHVQMTAANFRKVQPPRGWSLDRSAPGVISWISPSGGLVDFVTAGHEFPGGGRAPSRVTVDPSSKEYPVSTAVDIFRMKLNSMREKDLADMISLARAIGGVPTAKQLGDLNQTQGENLQLVQQWFKMRPSGGYGE
jgi:hypothetical protein